MGNAARKRSAPQPPAKQDTTKDNQIVLKGHLSRGGFGSVYSGECTGSNHKVAIKYVRKAAKPAKRLESDQRQEMAILSRIRHESIVEFYTTEETESGYCIVTELLEGGDLQKRLRANGPFSEKEAAQVLRQLASALAYIHKLGIAHRDVKPQNIAFASLDGLRVKLLDFGLAAEIPAGQSLHRLCGTPGFIAPEVEKGGYDTQVDNWSLGVVLYVMLTCRLPFAARKTGEPLNPSHYKLKENRLYRLSPQARALLRGLLHVDPAQRLTAAQTLAHPWFLNPRDSKRPSVTPSVSASVLSSLSSASRLSNSSRASAAAPAAPVAPVAPVAPAAASLDEDGDAEPAGAFPSPPAAPRTRYRRLQLPARAKAAVA